MSDKKLTISKKLKTAQQKRRGRILAFKSMAAGASGSLVSRAQLGQVAGITYNGRRDMYEALGYKRRLYPADYRQRFSRGAVAARIIEAKPMATWRGGGIIVEDETPDVVTPFEKAFEALDRRLNIWTTWQQADILAGMGHYAVLLIGAPGKLEDPLKKVKGPDDIIYLQPYSEADAPVATWDNDPSSPRFGLPVTYSLTRPNPSTLAPIITNAQQGNNRTAGRPVHFSRIIHIADGLLDDRINGIPRLERCWNNLDDLDKVTGGGAEAFWRRADAGLQVDVDPEMELEPGDEQQLDEEIDEYLHDLRRVVRTRGVKMTPLTSQVAGIKDPIEGIMSQISAGTGIPQRILMGSERGQLASTQDDDNWTTRVSDRREAYARPVVTNPTIDRFITIGALPKPQDDYRPRWPEIDDLDNVQKANVAVMWASINQSMGQVVVLPNEIRDRLLGLPPIEDIANPDVIDGEIIGGPEATKKLTPGEVAAARVRFDKKWACLTFNKKVAYLKKKFPVEFKEHRSRALLGKSLPQTKLLKGVTE